MTARGTLVALLLPCALLLAACGDEPGPAAADPVDPTPGASDTATPSEPTEATSEPEPELPDWPACGEVWAAGAQLPRAYQGCLEGETAVEADRLSCSSGQHLVRYADRFYAVPGGTIHRTSGPLEKDKGYLGDIASCRG